MEVVLHFAGINATVLTTPAIALQLRLGFACFLNLTVQQVLLNSTYDYATQVYSYLPSTGELNTVFASCTPNTLRALVELLQGLAVQGKSVAANGLRGLSAPSVGTDVAMLIVIPPAASPTPGASPALAGAQLASANSILAAITNLLASENSTTLLSTQLSGFVQAVATALGVPVSSVLSTITLTAETPSLITPIGAAPTPAPPSSGGLTDTQKAIIGGVIGGVSGLVILTVFGVLVYRRRVRKGSVPVA